MYAKIVNENMGQKRGVISNNYLIMTKKCFQILQSYLI